MRKYDCLWVVEVKVGKGWYPCTECFTSRAGARMYRSKVMNHCKTRIRQYFRSKYFGNGGSLAKLNR